MYIINIPEESQTNNEQLVCKHKRNNFIFKKSSITVDHLIISISIAYLAGSAVSVGVGCCGLVFVDT